MRGLRLLVGVCVAGVSLGVMGRAAAYMPNPFELASVLGMPWLLCSAAAGYAARGAAEGALAGAALLMVAVVSYYSFRWGVEDATPYYAASMVMVWGFFGTLLGAVFGLAGAGLRASSAGWRVAAVGLLAGTLLGEGLLYLSHARGHGSDQALLLAEATIGASLPLLLMRGGWQRASALGLTGAIAVAAALGSPAVQHFARLHGWAA